MASTTEKKETAREVAVAILKKKGGGPIKVVELADLVVKSGRTKLSGKTPEATVAAHIYTAAKKGVLFEKTGRGEVKLLAGGAPAAAKEKPSGGASRGSGKAGAKDGAAKRGSSSASKKTPAGGGSGRRGRGGRPPASDDVQAGDRAALGADDETGGGDLDAELVRAAAAVEQEPAESPEPAPVG